MVRSIASRSAKAVIRTAPVTESCATTTTVPPPLSKSMAFTSNVKAVIMSSLYIGYTEKRTRLAGEHRIRRDGASTEGSGPARAIREHATGLDDGGVQGRRVPVGQ